MQVTDWITGALAIYGAILSTYLALREIKKEHRKIKMTLEFHLVHGKARLIVLNSGYRPLTIRNINISLRVTGTKYFEDVPANHIFSTREPEIAKFISDGETVIYEFGGPLSYQIGEIFTKDKTSKIEDNINISLYDTEGNIYKKYSTWENYSR